MWSSVAKWLGEEWTVMVIEIGEALEKPIYDMCIEHMHSLCVRDASVRHALE